MLEWSVVYSQKYGVKVGGTKASKKKTPQTFNSSGETLPMQYQDMLKWEPEAFEGWLVGFLLLEISSNAP